MIYTTYFARLRYLPKDIIPISICAKAPDWFTGLQYKKVAPTYDILMNWKRNNDVEEYTYRYYNEILSKLVPEQVIQDLTSLCSMNKDTLDYKIALVCYEKSSDFCHRHLLASWLNSSGMLIHNIEEYDYNK